MNTFSSEHCDKQALDKSIQDRHMNIFHASKLPRHIYVH